MYVKTENNGNELIRTTGYAKLALKGNEEILEAPEVESVGNKIQIYKYNWLNLL